MRTTVSTVIAALAVCAVVAAAEASVGKIGPGQTFTGLVNGKTSGAVIRMGCFGPSRAGQLGHPLAGQSLEVLPAATAAAGGYTGKAHQIAAYALFSTPLASAVVPRLAVFSYYGAPAPIPTDVLLPCWGDGTVSFDPVDGGSTARAAVVDVSFQGQP